MDKSKVCGTSIVGYPYGCSKCNKVFKYGEEAYSHVKKCYEFSDGVASKPSLEKDMVNHPSHYVSGGIETIDFLKAKLGQAGFEGFLAGNILKYVTRYELKNGVEDLKKARWYLNKLIEEKDS